ncbi:MAG: galactokinase, partial [Lachnospiraceae bacterium]|nr:galactokinase [Lachnospiraceae bacterium]
MKEKMLEIFGKVFGDKRGARVFFAPGRVNLIGEYTDFNGGHVFPCALTMGTYAAVRARDDRKLRFYSENFDNIGIIESSLDELVYDRKNKWANYCLGVIKAFEDRDGVTFDRGFDFCCYGNIPNGAGLSSSASIEVLTAKALIELFGKKVDMTEAALISQHAERNFVGMNCGIMDQFAIAMGKKEHAIFLDTGTLDYKYVPVKLDGMKIVIGNTNKKRKLTDSKYNERRAECEAAL